MRAGPGTDLPDQPGTDLPDQPGAGYPEGPGLPGPGRGARFAWWAGIILGTAAVAEAYRHGARPKIPGMHGFPGLAVAALLTWLIVTGVAVMTAQLLRRHHRAMAAATWQGGRNGAAAAARAGRRRAGRVHARAAARWQRRGNTWRAPLILTRPPRAADGGGDAPDPRPGRLSDPVARDQRLALTDPAGAPAPADTQENGNGDHHMSPPVPRTEAARPTRAGRSAPGPWRALADDTADFEPEDDRELLEWMSGQVVGMLAYGEALVEVHETCVSTVRLDPAAIAALHDVGDAVADAAEEMARAIEKFKQVYEGPREFVGEGGVLPKDGDWLVGEDE